MKTRLLAGAVAATALTIAMAVQPALALAAPTLAAPAVPTFVNGLAQAVFSTNPADWYSGEVWVEAPFDSDSDGRPDRIHADFTTPSEVLTDGLKVPVIFEDSPYYAGFAPVYSNWA
ncbi:MAG TPA: hypothetical protein VHJ83_14335, partial [Micromonosporaceae bacterium]|nr:hypothetical protein [Micromonosporaceae bacterium]